MTALITICSSSLGIKFLSRRPVIESPSLCPSLNCTGQISRPHKCTEIQVKEINVTSRAFPVMRRMSNRGCLKTSVFFP